jgi:hypothetical protein
VPARSLPSAPRRAAPLRGASTRRTGGSALLFSTAALSRLTGLSLHLIEDYHRRAGILRPTYVGHARVWGVRAVVVGRVAKYLRDAGRRAGASVPLAEIARLAEAFEAVELDQLSDFAAQRGAVCWRADLRFPRWEIITSPDTHDFMASSEIADLCGRGVLTGAIALGSLVVTALERAKEEERVAKRNPLEVEVPAVTPQTSETRSVPSDEMFAGKSISQHEAEQRARDAARGPRTDVTRS